MCQNIIRWKKYYLILTIQLVNIYIMIIDYYIKLFTHTHTHTHIYGVCIYNLGYIYILHDYVVAKYSHMFPTRTHKWLDVVCDVS